jgi:hypothetical protein
LTRRWKALIEAERVMKSCLDSRSRVSALALVVVTCIGGVGGNAGAENVSRAPGAMRPGLSSVEAFDRATDSARQIASGGGDSVTRAELRGAIGFFQHDDGIIDSAERACLSNFLADTAAQDSLSGAARKYAVEFLELNADLPQAPLAVSDVQTSLVELFGAAGALTSSVWLQDARVTGNGVIAQATLRAAYGSAFNASASTFDPINLRELINELSGRLELGTPTQDEVDGVVTFLTGGGSQSNKAASRLYLASWIASGRGGEPGDLGGVVIAAVSSDRRSVRFLEVHAWTE